MAKDPQANPNSNPTAVVGSAFTSVAAAIGGAGVGFLYSSTATPELGATIPNAMSASSHNTLGDIYLHRFHALSHSSKRSAQSYLPNYS
jgi:hypothetical protein